MTSDSIQTLLKQRRDLRECLQEIRSEVVMMHQKTDSLVEKALGKNNNSSAKSLNHTPLVGTADILSDPAAALKLIQHVASEKVAVSGTQKETPPLNSSRKSSRFSTSGTISATENNVEATHPQRIEQYFTPTKPDEADKSDKPGKADNPDFFEFDKEIKEGPDMDRDTLLNHAILLAGFFLHQPSSSGNTQLNQLDAAIRQVKALPGSEKKNEAVLALKNAYRNVLAATYATAKVTGQTISDSRSSVTLLWSLPMVISSMVLVVLPSLLLVRSLAERMFVSGFSDELMLAIGAAIAFVWGAIGVLACLTLGIAKDVNKCRYKKGQIRDMGLRAALGGVLGMGVFLGYTLADLLTGLREDIAVSLCSLLIGGASCLAIGYLQNQMKRKKQHTFGS